VRKKNVCFIGTTSEFEGSKELLKQTGFHQNNIIHLLPEEVFDEQQKAKKEIIADAIKFKNISEIIFGTEGIPMTSIIHAMMYLSEFDIDFKIALHGGDSIVGSNSVEAQGELYTLGVMPLAKPVARRQKRVFDILSSALIVLLFPILWIFITKPLMVLKSAIQVFIGAKTWIGYTHSNAIKQNPTLKPSVFYYGIREKGSTRPVGLDFYYAQHFSITLEASELIRNIFKN